MIRHSAAVVASAVLGVAAHVADAIEEHRGSSIGIADPDRGLTAIHCEDPHHARTRGAADVRAGGRCALSW